MKKLISKILILIIVFSIIFLGKYLFEREISEIKVEDIRVTRLEADTLNKKNYNSEFQYEEKKDKIKVKTEIVFDIEANSDKVFIDSIENYAGWIQIDNTQIDYPIVKGEDNDFYLNHNYDLSKNIAGAIFMDRRNLGNSYDQHTIIYGHYMKNGSMFTDLNSFLDPEFYENNKYIVYRDLFKNYTYEVISAYYVSADDYDLAYDITSATVDEFINNSIFDTEYVYKDSDRILTLSTCNYILNNGRMIVHAVLKKWFRYLKTPPFKFSIVIDNNK